MAFNHDQITQYAWILNQYIEETVTFASQLVQLQKIASLSSNNFFCQAKSDYQLHMEITTGLVATKRAYKRSNL